jgi:hypothetical protein
MPSANCLHYPTPIGKAFQNRFGFDELFEFVCCRFNENVLVCSQGDYSRQNKTINKVTERFMPVPDSVLQTAASSVVTGVTADPTLGGVTPLTDFIQIGGARKQVLGLNLDRVRHCCLLFCQMMFL